MRFKAHQAGIPIISGGESGWSPVPYGRWHARELEILMTHLFADFVAEAGPRPA